MLSVENYFRVSQYLLQELQSQHRVLPDVTTQVVPRPNLVFGPLKHHSITFIPTQFAQDSGQCLIGELVDMAVVEAGSQTAAGQQVNAHKRVRLVLDALAHCGQQRRRCVVC